MAVVDRSNVSNPDSEIYILAVMWIKIDMSTIRALIFIGRELYNLFYGPIVRLTERFAKWLEDTSLLLWVTGSNDRSAYIKI